MNIGFDIDGVLTNEEDYIFECMTKYCYENHLNQLIDPTGYETRKFKNSKELFDVYQEKYVWEYAMNGKPRLFASEVIHKLKKEGHKIYIITSRRPSYIDSEKGQRMRDTIKDWLEKNDIVYDGLFFEPDKTIKIKELKLDVMIEDSPITIPIFKDMTFILCFDNRYNADLVCPNMTRVYSFYDIYEKLQNLQKLKQNNK